MSIHIAIQHKTSYRFDRRVTLFPHVFRLRPAPHTRTPVLAYSLKIAPETHFINWQQDPFGNYQARVVFNEPAWELEATVEVLADMQVLNPFDFFIEDSAENYPVCYGSRLGRELLPYFEITDNGPRLRAWLAGIDRGGRRSIDFLVDLVARVNRDIGYGIRLEPGVQTCEETLTLGKGSCRDSAWLMVQALRHLGLAARFVSGYLVQLVPDVKALDGPSGAEADFTDLHAWTEVYLPGAGWIGLDPTSGLLAGEGHIPLACTPHYSSAAPVTGTTGKCEVEFSFSNSIERIAETPRVTKPYTAEQWAEIDALGERVDAALEAGDVRLTMGGEPTFVSIDDMEGDEWNITADSPAKRRLGHELLVRLHHAFAPGGARLCGEGKWYPGEPLPRWAYTVFWRTDGVPVWEDEALLADPQSDAGHGVEEARRLGEEVARLLRVGKEHLKAGHEDAFYYAWKEGTLPADVDPCKADINDPEERKILAALLDRGLDVPAGFALPVHWNATRGAWQSSPWEFRRPEMFLIPGSSPMGFRLPLDSLPWAAREKRPLPQERSPLNEVEPPLADFQAKFATGRAADGSAGSLAHHPQEHEAADEALPDEAGTPIAHTAMCFEPRHGRVHVFMPPANLLEHYLDLLAAVNAAASHLQLAVVLEGYAPPHDNRLQRISVTPDPGVIEVNIHPSASWQEAKKITETLHEEARLTRLGTEKFLLDGRHTGTGGGNHVTLGGRRPADSPFLRRPGLLRSLLTYWQHHPGLSYLFSGLFIGPTSQAPRVDEGRDEKLYELEIAFQQLPDAADAPWIVDRVLRNLLTDLTGNTHRAEFCIDKLYSPDSTYGRLGILEFRGFEMPPHPRMSLVQALLLRSLIAWFWDHPYHHRLVRWGTELHDRFMLPFFIRNDLRDVAADLQDAGFPFQLDWLDPFLEFRFPRHGSVQRAGIELELRSAIEPWHVLGEETTAQGTSRYVDSSVERLQVKVRGMTDTRHAVLCNGRRLPLFPTGTRGEYVAGVRYKAWDPHSALHPTIGVQSPLVFDLVDTWNGRSVGGCVYHVSHPGGRSYDTLPVNAYEAEGRRATRFWQHGHTPRATRESPPDPRQPGRTFPENAPKPERAVPPPEEINGEFPLTFDLRHDGALVTTRGKPFAT